MKKLLLGCMLVLSSIVFGQETFQYKGFGQNIIYEFKDNTLICNTNGVIKEVPVKMIGKDEKISVYEQTEPYMGILGKYTFVHRKNDKYTLIFTSFDTFTKQSVEGIIKVTKIK